MGHEWAIQFAAAMSSLTQLFLLLIFFQVKHFIADGPLQTKRMVDEKGRYGATLGLVHSGLHAVGTFIVVFLVMHASLWAVLLAAIDFAIHYHVDYAKERMVRYFNWTPANGPFWWAIMGDQMLHHLTYIGLSAAAVAG